MVLQHLRGTAAGGKLNSRPKSNTNVNHVALSTSAHRALNDGDDIYMIEESIAAGSESVAADEENKDISSVVANASVAVQQPSSVFPTTKRGRWLRQETAKIRGKITIPKVMTKITTRHADQHDQMQPIFEERVLFPDIPDEDCENQPVDRNEHWQQNQNGDGGRNKPRHVANAIRNFRKQLTNQRQILVPWSNNADNSKSNNNIKTTSHTNGKFSPPRFLRQGRRQAVDGAINKSYQEVSEQQQQQQHQEGSTIDHSEVLDTKSIRSSRLDVATGKTLMTRQGAQVFTRPTTNIHTKWDTSLIVSPKNYVESLIYQSSSPSSLSPSKNTQSPRQRSITIDNSSCVSGISDVTEETTTITMRPPGTSYYSLKKQKKNPNNKQQRLPMFIRSKNDNNLLPRNTFRIDEEEVCSDGVYDDDDEEVIDFTGVTTDLFNGSYDFRALDDEVQSVGVQRCPSVSPRSATTQDLSLSNGASNKLGQVLRRNNIREMDVIWDLLATENAAPVAAQTVAEQTSDIDCRRRFFSDSEIVVERHGVSKSNDDERIEERSQLSTSLTPRSESQDPITSESVRRRTASGSFFTFREATPSDLRSSSRLNRHRTQSDSFLPLERVDCFEEDSQELSALSEMKTLSRHEAIFDENRFVSSDTDPVVRSKNAFMADDRIPFAEKQLGQIQNSTPLPLHQSSPQSLKYANIYQSLHSNEGVTSKITAGSYYWDGIDGHFGDHDVVPTSPSNSFESYSDIL